MKFYVLALALFCLTACDSEEYSEVHPLGEIESESPVTQSDWEKPIVSEITKLMDEQQQCWNLADLQCFMEPYWHSDSLMFIGKSGVNYGWQKTFDNYIASYPDARAMGKLKFDNILIEPLTESMCYVIGKWHLTREEGDLEGHYTLMWKLIDGQWLIVSDHSS